MKTILLLILLSSILLADKYSIQDHSDGWGIEHKEDEHNHDDHAGHDHAQDEHDKTETAGMISINPERLKEVEIKIENPIKKKLFKQMIVPAKVVPDPFYRSFIAAPYNARVYFKGASRNLYRGDRVQKGEKIITLIQSGLNENPIDLKLVGQEISIEIRYARKDLNRLKKLSGRNLIGAKELLAGEQRLKLALVKRDHFYQKQGRLRGKNQIRLIKAPADGIIDQFYVQNGAQIKAGEPLLALYSKEHLQIEGKIFQGDIQNPEMIQSISIQHSNGKRESIATDQILNQRFDFRSKKLFASIYIKWQQSSQLSLGAALSLHLGIGKPEAKMVVPASAIIRINTVPYLLLKKSSTTYQLKEVHTGDFYGDLVEIRSGITPKDHIVTKGGLSIYNQTAGSVDPHAGHNH